MAINDALSSPAPESLEVSGHGFEFTFRAPSAPPSMACSDKSDSEVAEGSDKMSFASEAPSTPYTEEDIGFDSDLESPPAKLSACDFSDNGPDISARATSPSPQPLEPEGSSQDFSSASFRTPSPVSSADDSLPSPLGLIKHARSRLLKRVISTPPPSPEKQKARYVETQTGSRISVTSSIRDGLGKAKGGLIKFFGTLATEDDKKMDIARWREGREGTYTQGQGFKQPTDQQNAARQEHKKDGARIRQQKHRK